MQALPPVEFVVLKGVNDVEANQPEYDRHAEQQGDDPRLFGEGRGKSEAALDRKPGSDGRERQRQAEPEMSVIREPFRQGIEADKKEGYRRETEANRIEQPTGHNETAGAQETK